MKPSRLDAILIGVLLLLSLAVFAGARYVSVMGSELEVYHGEELLKTLSLEVESKFIVKTSQGSLELQIKDGQAMITKVDCPRQICRSMGPISKAGQSMICLPNKIIVKIRSENDPDLDAVTE